MKLVQLLFLLFICIPSLSFAATPREYRIRLSLDDAVIVKGTKDYAVEIKDQLILNFANVHVTPRTSGEFDLMLFFKADTQVPARYDTPQKLQSNLLQAARTYLPYVVESEIILREFFWKSRHGYLTILTDRQLAEKTHIPKGDFKYLTKGIVRISDDSVLSFSLMTNEVGTDDYDRLLAYVKGFVL